MNLRSVSRAAVLLGLAAIAGIAGSATAAVPPEAYSALRWRLVGPLRGGWATSATGVPGKPDTFYMGTADGGVWTTADAGRTWNPLFDHEGAASVGALALAPSDPAVLYVGTGQVSARWDITSGNGIYRTGDGGRTWEHRGLADSYDIGRLWIDPRNADVVLAAAQGHLFGPNAERGVLRTTDGGKTWSKVLFVDENAGAVDLSGDPAAPDVLFASTWQVRGHPWLSYFRPAVGASVSLKKPWRNGEGGLKVGPRGSACAHLCQSGRLKSSFRDTSGLPSRDSRLRWPSHRANGCQRTSPAGYPATKGSPGGKLPAGNGALRSPAFNFSAAVRKSETNQE